MSTQASLQISLNSQAPSNTNIKYFLRFVQLAYQVHKERKQLKKMDPALLSDIGITQDQINHEVKKDMFDLPQSRINCIK